MGEVIPLRRAPDKGKRNSEKESHAGKTLCRSGFHKWIVDKSRPFDVQNGKLISRYCCKRCGATRVEAR